MRRKLLAIVLSLALALSVQAAVLVLAKDGAAPATRESAPLPDKELGSAFVLGDDAASRNIVTSPIDGVNLTVTAQGDTAGSKNQFVVTRIKLAVSDLSGADALVIRANNCGWSSSVLGVSLVDGDGSVFRTDKDFSASGNTLEANKYYLLNSLADESPTEKYLHSMAAHLPDSFNGYVKLPFAGFGYRWGGDETLDLSDVSHIEIEVDTHYNQWTKLNVGEIGVFSGGDYTAVTSAASYTIVSDGAALQANEVFKSFDTAGDKTGEHLALTKVSAGRMITKNNYPAANWSAFMMLIPTDISAYNGISYYADTTGSRGDVFFNKYMREWQNNASGEEWYCDGGFATYLPDGGEAYIGDANTIPKNFKGRITVPFTNFAIPGWFQNVDNGVLDLDKLWWNFGFTFDLSRGEYDFILKDVRLTADAREFIRLPQNTAWQGDVKTVLPFDYFDDFDLGSDWFNTWDKAADCAVECVDTPASGVLGVSGKAMRFTCGDVKTVENASDETALEHYPTGEQKNLAGAKGFTFWIKNTSSTQVGFNFGFDLLLAKNTQQRWTSKINARYKLFNTKTNEQVIANGKGGLYVPAGFEGWVRIDFAQFEKPSWEPNSGDFDSSFPLAYFVINMNSRLHLGDSFILDSLGFYYTDVEIATTFYTPEYSFADAMSTPYTEE